MEKFDLQTDSGAPRASIKKSALWGFLCSSKMFEKKRRKRVYFSAFIILLLFFTPNWLSGQSQITLEGYRVNQGGSGTWSTGYTTGNLGNGWDEGEWVPYKITLTGLTAGFTNFDSVIISFDFTNSQGYRFVDMAKSFQVGRVDLTDLQGFPDAGGNALPLTTETEINYAQTINHWYIWTNYNKINLPQSQINAPVVANTVTALRRSVKIYRSDLINSGVSTTAGEAYIYFKLHLSRTFVWSQALQSNYDAPPTDGYGGYVYSVPPFDTDSRLAAGYVSGSSGHVSLDNYGKKTVPIPIPAKLTGGISGYKFLDNNRNAIWDIGEPPVANYPIYLTVNMDDIVFIVMQYTDTAGKYEFTDLQYGTWYIFEGEDPPPYINYRQTYPNASTPTTTTKGPIMEDPTYTDTSLVLKWGWMVINDDITPVVDSVNFGNYICVPVTSTDLTGQTVCEGSSYTFVTTPSGSTPFTYIWTYNGQVINGENDSTLALQGLTVSQSGQYCVLVENDCGSAMKCASLVVEAQISDNTIAADQTICQGDTATQLTGSLPQGGNGSYNYVWQYSTDSLNWATIGGATGQNYQPPHLLQATWYRRIVSAGVCDPDTSNLVKITLIITPPPVVSDVDYCLNDQAVPLTAQGTNLKWYDAQKNPLTGAPTPSTTTAGAFIWYVTSTDNGCESMMAMITVTVHPPPTVTISPPAPQICIGDSITLVASGGVNYQWSPATGLNTTSGNTVIAKPLVTITYTVTVTDSFGCVNSGSVIVTVKPLPVCSISGPDNQCPESNVLYTGPGGMDAYLWAVGGPVSIVGSNSNSQVTVHLNSNCGATYTVTLTVTKDGCSSTCSQTYTILNDTVKPVLSGVPQDVTIPCTTPVSAPPTVTATDNCGLSGPVTYNQQTTPGNCAGNYTITRTWSATDHCSNTATAQQVITVIDTVPPVITCPQNVTIQCTADTSASANGQATATDNCSGVKSITWSNAIVPGNCAGNYTINRTWNAEDSCGNISSCLQVITVIDTVPPVITCPPNVTIECTADTSASANGQATAIDNCSGVKSITWSNSIVPGNCAGNYTINRTWSAEDSCGNISNCLQVITVIDTVPPVITCPQNVTIECTADTSASANGMATATDNCSGVKSITWSNSIVQGNCAGNYTINRTWSAEDSCGNISSCLQVITVIDTVPPVITCPQNVTIECTADTSASANGQATAIDNCSGVKSITWSNSIVPGNCAGNYTINRTWSAEDSCGNISSCLQVITVIDTVPPVITCPQNVTIECTADTSASVNGMATATDNCSGVKSITWSNSIVPGSCADSYMINRTWSAEDSCGNISTCLQTITVIDTVKPVLSPLQSDVMVCYDDTVTIDQVSATDNCDPSPTVTFTRSDSSALGPNNWFPVGTTTVTWTATDRCGNSTSHSFDVTRYPMLSCLIQAPANDPLCMSTGNILQATVQGAETYMWSVTSADSSWVITSGTDTTQITYNAGNSGVSAIFKLIIMNGDSMCVDSCEIELECKSSNHCTMTQGFYGNVGGKYCDTIQTLTLLKQLLATPLIIGGGSNTLSLYQSDTMCLISRLPGGGPSKALNGMATCQNPVGILIHKKKDNFKNTLLAQTITLGLNMRLDTNLGGLTLSSYRIITSEVSGCDMLTDTIIPFTQDTFDIPLSVYNYFGYTPTVMDIYNLANQALAGTYVPGSSGPSLGDITEALGTINEAFDECRIMEGFDGTQPIETPPVLSGIESSDVLIRTYPNPTMDYTTIEFKIPADGHATLEIFNLSGELLNTLVNESVNGKQEYQYRFNGKELPPAVYIYRFTFEERRYYGKIILMK